jgi:hypothetical protein
MSRYHLLMAGAKSQPKNLYQILTEYSLTGGLVGAWDAGASASYSGSGQTWTNLTTSSVFTMSLGSSTSADAADPTFNGTAGSLDSSTYFSCASDYFTNTSASSFRFGKVLHQSGVGHGGLMLFGTSSTIGVNTGLVGTYGGSGSNHGFAIDISAGNAFRILFSNGDGSTETTTIGPSVAANTWYLMYYYMKPDGSPNFYFYINGTSYNPTVSLASPSSSDSTYNLQVGARGNGNAPFVNDWKIACCAFWDTNTALTESQVNNIRNRLKERFSTL